MSARASAVALAVIVLAGTALVYTRSVGPSTPAATFRHVAFSSEVPVSASPPAALVLPTPRFAITKPVAAPVPQAPARSCSALVLKSLTVTGYQVRQLVVTWSTSGGCPWFQISISWSGSGIAGWEDGAFIGPASGSKTETIRAGACPSTSSSAVVNFTMGDSVGHWVHQTVVTSVTLC